MGIIPKEDEEKEPIGIIAVILVHHFLGLGILVIGQRTKNVIEFWAGLIIFLLAIAWIFMGFSAFGTVEGFQESLFGTLYTLFSLVTWIYIAGRLIWIFMKKETKIKIF